VLGARCEPLHKGPWLPGAQGFRTVNPLKLRAAVSLLGRHVRRLVRLLGLVCQLLPRGLGGKRRFRHLA
jgi:hypothetical protein